MHYIQVDSVHDDLHNVPTDLTLTVDRLKVLFQSVKDPDIFAFAGIGDMLGLPESALEEIKRSYQSNTKRKEAYLDTYTHHHPCPSWKKISEVLRGCELDQQAEEVENNYVQGTVSFSYGTQFNFALCVNIYLYTKHWAVRRLKFSRQLSHS